MVIGKKRKIKNELIKLCNELIKGDILLEFYLDYLAYRDDLLIFLNKILIMNGCSSNLLTITKIKEQIKDSFNMRVYAYQTAREFLFVNNIKFEIKAKDYLFFENLSKQCPDWFQNDWDLLNSIYKNLNELVVENKLGETILKDFKYDDYPPEWLQAPEWPVIDGIIYEFESQSKNPNDLDYDEDSITYIFKNSFTGEKKEVIQYY